jgi:hypothetical protein
MTTTKYDPREAITTAPLVAFRSRRSGYEHRERIWLYPELDCWSVIDNLWSDDGRIAPSPEDALAYWIDYLGDAEDVAVGWSVFGDRNCCESAPFTGRDDENFLSAFTWPEFADGPREGERVDWWTLPVINSRFPILTTAMGGWLPAPLTPRFPLRQWGEAHRQNPTSLGEPCPRSVQPRNPVSGP